MIKGNKPHFSGCVIFIDSIVSIVLALLLHTEHHAVSIEFETLG